VQAQRARQRTWHSTVHRRSCMLSHQNHHHARWGAASRSKSRKKDKGGLAKVGALPHPPFSKNPRPAQPHATHRRAALARAAVPPTPAALGTCSRPAHTCNPKQRRLQGPQHTHPPHMCRHTLARATARPLCQPGNPTPPFWTPCNTHKQVQQSRWHPSHTHSPAHTKPGQQPLNTQHKRHTPRTAATAQRLACRYALAPQPPPVCCCVAAPTKQNKHMSLLDYSTLRVVCCAAQAATAAPP
jgi:hypothetical protein